MILNVNRITFTDFKALGSCVFPGQTFHLPLEIQLGSGWGGGLWELITETL